MPIRITWLESAVIVFSGMMHGIMSCRGSTTSFGSVVITVNVSNSVPQRPARAYGLPSFVRHSETAFALPRWMCSC
jgi:hypothetical protein